MVVCGTVEVRIVSCTIVLMIMQTHVSKAVCRFVRCSIFHVDELTLVKFIAGILALIKF